jgi:thiamine biosynthesis lipoprotein
MNGGTEGLSMGEAVELTGMVDIEFSPRHELSVLKEGLLVDLGGIGKGYALDRMGERLADWGLTNALLRASTSTVLGLGAPTLDAAGWAVTRSHDGTREEIVLRDRAMSSSGREVQGDHIIDPRTGLPATHRKRVWVVAPDATLADALSTACMVMSDEEIRALLSTHPEVEAVVLDEKPGASPRGL